MLKNLLIFLEQLRFDLNTVDLVTVHHFIDFWLKLRNGCFVTQKRNNFIENAPYFTPKAFEVRKFDLPQLRYVGLWVSNKSNRSITSSRAPHHSKLLQEGKFFLPEMNKELFVELLLRQLRKALSNCST